MVRLDVTVFAEIAFNPVHKRTGSRLIASLDAMADYDSPDGGASTMRPLARAEAKFSRRQLSARCAI
jgi:hypothetical protein